MLCFGNIVKKVNFWAPRMGPETPAHLADFVLWEYSEYWPFRKVHHKVSIAATGRHVISRFIRIFANTFIVKYFIRVTYLWLNMNEEINKEMSVTVVVWRGSKVYTILLIYFDWHFLFVVDLSPVADKWSDSLLSNGKFGHCDGGRDHITTEWNIRVFGKPEKKIQKICR